MTQKFLVHDPIRTQPDAAITYALTLGCPMVQHGMTQWMQEQGVVYGANGYVAVVMCTTHAANREVLAFFKDAKLTKENISAVPDCPPDPPPYEEAQRALDIATVEAILPDTVKDAFRRLLQ